MGKGKERRKGRGWGSAPISSAPGRVWEAGRLSPGDLPGPHGADNPVSPSASLPSLRAGRGDRRSPSAGRRTPLPRPAPLPARRGACRGTGTLTWDLSRAASAVRTDPAALKPAPPSPSPPPGAGPQQSPADLSLSSPGSLPHPGRAPGVA